MGSISLKQLRKHLSTANDLANVKYEAAAPAVGVVVHCAGHTGSLVTAAPPGEAAAVLVLYF